MPIPTVTAPPPPGTTAHPGAHRFITPGFGIGFAVVVSLFFLWAIANNFNDILIRQFQKALALNRAEAGFIQFVFYLGYFLMALPAGILMRRFGYRAGILAGLGLYAVGALLFYPAAELREYAGFLGALFVLAAGAAFLETAPTPISLRSAIRHVPNNDSIWHRRSMALVARSRRASVHCSSSRVSSMIGRQSTQWPPPRSKPIAPARRRWCSCLIWYWPASWC